MEQHLGGVIKVWQRSEGDKINILHIIELIAFCYHGHGKYSGEMTGKKGYNVDWEKQ